MMMQTAEALPAQAAVPAPDPYEACTRLAREHYENFPVGRLVPKKIRPHVHAVYAFARVADDLADEGYADPRLRDASSQVLLLKSRYEHVEAKAAAERELYDRAVGALESSNAELRHTRGALQAAQADLVVLRGRLHEAGDAAEELRRARDEIRRLEVRAE